MPDHDSSPPLRRRRIRGRAFLTASAYLAALTWGAPVAAAQAPPPGAAGAQVDSAVLRVHNRDIVVFRVPLGAATPADRAAAASTRVATALQGRGEGEVTSRRDPAGILVALDGAPVFVLREADVDTVAGETLEQAAATAVARLRGAVEVERQARNLPELLRAAAAAALATIIFLLVLRALAVSHRALMRRLPVAARTRSRTLAVRGYTLLRADQVLAVVRRVLSLALWVLGLFVAYLWLTFVLTRFAYSRPWGEALGTYLRDTIVMLVVGTLHAVPGLFTVVLIFIATRWLVRMVRGFFDAVEARTVEAPWVHPETANPTRRIAVALLWLFALVVAYPYLPGSGSDVFKGISVFAGVVLSLGSSGVMNQAMSGLVLMYSRALRPGDYVRIGETEGVVTELGMLSTKVRSSKREEITLPNAVVVSTTIKNYTRLAAEGEGVLLYTTVTIGYDVPWRQVHGLLLTAADRTAGLRRPPEPFVLQTALSDFYIEYQLNVVLDDPPRRPAVLSELHRHIVDVFNEHGVQITSPHYVADPPVPTIVPRERWHAEPASRLEHGPATSPGGLAGDGRGDRDSAERTGANG